MMMVSSFVEPKRLYWYKTESGKVHQVLLFEGVPGGGVFPIIEREDGTLGRPEDRGRLTIDEWMKSGQLTFESEEEWKDR